MRARPILAAGISATALILSGMSTGASGATDEIASRPRGAVTAVAQGITVAGGTRSDVGTPSGVAGVCGTVEGTWTGDGITSQKGGPSNPSLKTWGAKEVGCSPGEIVNAVVVDGYPNLAMNINFNVRVFKNVMAGDNPPPRPQPRDFGSAPVPICSYSNVPATFSGGGPTGAQWTIVLPAGCAMNATSAPIKRRWVAVQAVLDQSQGQWFWATQTMAGLPDGADWRDGANLFGLGCITFAHPTSGPGGADNGRNVLMQDCIFGGDVGEPDFMMTLS